MQLQLKTNRSQYRPGAASALALVVGLAFYALWTTGPALRAEAPSDSFATPDAAPSESPESAEAADFSDAASAERPGPMLLRALGRGSPAVDSAKESGDEREMAAGVDSTGPVETPALQPGILPSAKLRTRDPGQEIIERDAAAVGSVDEGAELPAAYEGNTADGFDLANLRIMTADTSEGIGDLLAHKLVVLELATEQGDFVAAEPADPARPFATLTYYRASDWDGVLSMLQLRAPPGGVDVPRNQIASRLATEMGVSDIIGIRVVFLADALASIVRAQEQLMHSLPNTSVLAPADFSLRGCFAGNPARFEIVEVIEVDSGSVVRRTHGCGREAG